MLKPNKKTDRDVIQPMQKFISIRAAAALISVHPQTAYQMAADGRLPVVRFGRILRVDLIELERRLAAQAEEGRG